MPEWFVVVGACLLWYALGLVGAGWVYAYLQDTWAELAEENRQKHLSLALRYALFGPVALVIGFILTNFGSHGWWKVRE